MPFNKELIAQKKLSFELLSDPGNKLATSYGIHYTVPEELREIYLKFGVDVPLHNGDDSWVLPMPARFIIDRTGTIRYAQYDPDYTTRPEPEETVAALKGLESAAEEREES